IHSITREEIRDVAKKYLNTNQRLVLDYVPAAKKPNNQTNHYEKHKYSLNPIFCHRNNASAK
ncbi:hypothetical protein BXU11_17480, partial [Flavobacterium sp. LM5]|uniref:hypothetical protein n=1 Tax=Flavobacterium sp. LM5 TaxID=1938610 RepID=UPI0009D62AE8